MKMIQEFIHIFFNLTIIILCKLVEIIFQRFIGSPLFEDIRKRAVFVHVDLPGQEDDAEDMGDDAPFPTMQVSFKFKIII